MTTVFTGAAIKSALIIVAHPDDEVLLCGGTIARMASENIAVHVVCLSSGNQGRGAATAESCAILGATHELLDYPTNHILVDEALVTRTDTLLETRQPDLVITHGPGLGQSQDHRAVCEAVRTSVSRRPWPQVFLLGNPPFATSDFRPTVFVDVTDRWDARMDAIDAYRSILDRGYMHHDYLRAKATWWAQVAGRAPQLVEAFELDLWRPPAV